MDRRVGIGIKIGMLCAAFVWMGCTREVAEGIVVPEGGGEAGGLVELSFDLGGMGTRATQDIMAAGTKMQIYVYKKDGNVSGTPYEKGVYVVQSDLTATGGIKLYRGEYDLYLLSYNSDKEGDVPELSVGNTVDVANQKDFMYLTLKGIRVQPDGAGKDNMTVNLPSPFTRMGAKVGVSVCAPNTTQPVAISAIEVVSVVLKGLPASLPYKLGSDAWEAASGGYGSSYTFPGADFVHQGTAWFDPWVADAQVMLPVVPATGVPTLEFEVTLKVNNEAKEYTYKVPLEKMLLPGMMYKFEFSLKFYGALEPTDLTIAVKEYDEVNVSTDDLGKD